MRSIPGLSIDTKMLTDKLATLVPDDVITYSDLSQVIGRDVQNGARSNLYSAIRRLLADGKVYASVRGIGIKRLKDEEIVGVGPAVLAKMRRAANRARAKLAAVQDFDSLDRDAKISHNLSLSVLGVVAHMTKASTVKQLETRIDQAQASLPLAKTLEALAKS
jgi:hypothetical protein